MSNMDNQSKTDSNCCEHCYIIKKMKHLDESEKNKESENEMFYLSILGIAFVAFECIGYYYGMSICS